MGFTFNGKHSSDFGLAVKSLDRSLLPSLRKSEITVSGRHGTYDFEQNTYENRIISVDCAIKAGSIHELRQKARRIAGWLKDKGELRFDDEPDKYYIGRVYSRVPFENLFVLGRFTLNFECEPFAYSSTNMIEVIRTDDSPIFVYNNGTIEAPQEITITNLGENTIHGFTIKLIKNQ